MRNNRPVEELVRRQRQRDADVAVHPVSPPRALLEASARTACGLAAVALARALADTSLPPAHTKVVALDLASLQTTMHAVVRRPQCPTCGDVGLMAAAGERPIELQPVEKTHVEDGGYRKQSPRRTFEAYGHLVSSITGPVTHLVPVPERDTDLRAVYAS